MGINFDSAPSSFNDERIWGLGFNPVPVTVLLNMNKHHCKHKSYISTLKYKYILSKYTTWDIFQFGPDLFLRFSNTDKRKIGRSSNRPYILIPYGLVPQPVISVLGALAKNTEESLLYKIVEVKESVEG